VGLTTGFDLSNLWSRADTPKASRGDGEGMSSSQSISGSRGASLAHVARFWYDFGTFYKRVRTPLVALIVLTSRWLLVKESFVAYNTRDVSRN